MYIAHKLIYHLGQSISLTHLAPFVDISRKKIKKELHEENTLLNNTHSEEEIDKITEVRLKREIEKGVQTIQYQVVTLLTTNGQAPFLTVYMYLNEAKTEQEKQDLAMIIEEVLKQRYQGVKNEVGVWVSPAFPKLIYVLEENNITKDSKYWYLTELAAKCTAKRMVPDYISEKVMRELKGDVYTCMGCRSFLTPDRFTDTGIGNIANAKNYVPGQHKYYGRFNQGVVTINLVDIGLSARKNMNAFWRIFDERMELCHKALQARHKRLKGTISDVAPILWQYGALARLKKGETIDKLLYNGYSTISLGYAGLWECVYSLIEKKLTEPEGKELGLQIMRKLPKTSITASTARHWRAQPINLRSACKSVLASSKALPTAIILQTATTYTSPNPSRRLTSSSSKANFKHYLRAVPSAMLKYPTCKTTFPPFSASCNISTTILCTLN